MTQFAIQILNFKYNFNRSKATYWTVSKLEGAAMLQSKSAWRRLGGDEGLVRQGAQLERQPTVAA